MKIRYMYMRVVESCLTCLYKGNDDFRSLREEGEGIVLRWV